MKRIGLISDTHSFLHPKLFDFFKDVDEIWHAGDIGSIELIDKFKKFKPFKAVYGNIDNAAIRMECPKFQAFLCEDMKIMMTHIGGYPGRYESGIKAKIISEKPDIFISGHSHILKVINDPTHNLLHLNPGSAGKSGFHKVITFMRFAINQKRITDLEIMEINR